MDTGRLSDVLLLFLTQKLDGDNRMALSSPSFFGNLVQCFQVFVYFLCTH